MALTDSVKQEIRDALTNVKQNLAGFRDRTGQRLMIAEIAKTLAGEYGGKRIIAVEGPTGTGKTLGYMLAAIPVAKAEKKKLVISTATIALQEQIISRDLPALQEASDLKFTYALAKGRRRYVCNRNLERLTGHNPDQTGLDFGNEEDLAVWTRRPEKSELAALEAMATSLANGSWDGDMDLWADPLPEGLAERITTDRHACMGSRCQHLKRCAFIAARKVLDQVDVIVANHDLVLASLALEEGKVLPKPGETIYVFDEGHHLADKAIEHFSASAGLLNTAQWLEKLWRLTGTLRAVLPETRETQEFLNTAPDVAGELATMLKRIAQYVAANFPSFEGKRDEEQRWRFRNGVVPELLRSDAEQLLDPTKKLLRGFEGLRKKLSDAVGDGKILPGVAEGPVVEIGAAIGRLEKLYDAWSMMCEPDKENAPPTARWISKTQNGGRTDYVVTASPVTAYGMLQFALWDKCAAAVVTSATLTALGKFDRLRMATGLHEGDGTQYLKLSSPFNYQDNGVLYVPWMKSDPKDQAAHTAEITALLPELLDPAEGSLVLFTSARQMLAVAADLPQELQEMLLIQGEIPKHEILRRHREAIEQGRGSVIFGLDSFAEGVDLPGALCTHVVIAKLPFAVPDSPVEATLAEWMESRGQNPFMLISVPDACLKLIQACGRLIRTETDTGQITLLDRRIVTARYGRMILDSLPPFHRIIERGPGQRRVA